MNRIGLLGGTFDPPHAGHLALARAALSTQQVDQVVLLPAGLPPHKHRPDLTPVHHRLAMTLLLAQEDPRLQVDDLETRRAGPSYMVDTLRQLHAQRPGICWRLIIGADMALDFATWRDAERVAELAPPLVAERPGSPLPHDLRTAPPPRCAARLATILQEGRFPMPPVDLSSTNLREALRRGDSPQDRLPPAIAEYIRTHGLYR